MRGTSLVQLLTKYRSESRMSRNVAHNAADRDRQVEHIQTVQEWLWEDFDWPMLRVSRTVEIAAGQNTYDMPDDLHLDRTQKAELWYGGRYLPLTNGIDARHYSTFNPALDQRSWPITNWRIAEDEQLEVWPMPSQDYDATTLEGHIKLTGIRKLRPLIADTDVADLDDQLIVMFCAAEVLAATGAKDANLKLDKANKRYNKLRGNQQRRRVTSMFGGQQSQRPERIPIAVYNPTS